MNVGGEHTTRWFAFIAVCIGYLATTTGESLLSPVFPIAASEVGLDPDHAGFAFAALAGAIAAANLVSGVMLRYVSANVMLAAAVIVAAAGDMIVSFSHGAVSFLTGQALIGVSAGLLYPAAIMSVGVFAGPNRRGLAMGIFGVFFSGGLALAAGLVALDRYIDWRASFLVATTLAVIALFGVAPLHDAPMSHRDTTVFAGLNKVLGTPSAVGVVGGVSQYATVSFLPLFAVAIWDFSASAGATALLLGRILSVPAKLISGSIADRRGAEFAARLMGVVLCATGMLWALSPITALGVGGAVVFAALVSGLFPLANLLAFNRVGRQGGALGAFRSLQLGAGALAGLIVGAASDRVGLRTTVALATVLPLVLVLIRDESAAANGKGRRQTVR